MRPQGRIFFGRMGLSKPLQIQMWEGP